MASHYKRWSEQEDEFLLGNHKTKGIKYCAQLLNRTSGACLKRINNLHKRETKENE